MSIQSHYAAICEAAGIDTVREHFGLMGNQKVDLDAGGLELWQRIKDAAVSIIKTLGGSVDDTTLAELKAALDMALDKAFEIIDWPYIPDALLDIPLRKLAHWSLERAYQAIKAGS